MKKMQLFTELNKDRQTHKYGHKPLKWEHFMKCVKLAWENGFTFERNLKVWRIEGLIPFNRNALWRKKEALSKNLTTFKASTGHSAIAAVIPSSTPAADSTAAEEVPDAAPTLPPMSDTVEDAIRFVRKDKATTAIAQLSYEELLAAHLRLLESSDVLASYADASAEKPKAPEKQRIAARLLFRLGGSDTGPESRAMAQAKHAETQAEKEDNAAKREEKKKKKGAEVASAIIQGEQVLQALELNGEAQLNVLTIADINALLINADSQGTGPKPKSKKEGLLRVRVLPTVLAALE